ncbi:MAG TPA: hypothetical protein VFV69_11780 [Steroidobacteraceae bacterium]|jgi:hypothetical protein|nr:hypothetical protein [Steroidobacteraceae bacterium]
MSVYLLKAVDRNSEGPETVLRVVGSREPPARMVVQIAVSGSALVQIQARIDREAPWQNVGSAQSASALIHVDAVQFLRATATNVAAGAKVSVWATWAW